MARRIADLGHEAKLISPQFVRPFVKSKNVAPLQGERHGFVVPVL
ncbi:hypothetical protein ACZ87_03327, partial [Candidatus Erwinia dacicola]